MSCSSYSRTVLDPDTVYSLDEGFKASSYLTETLLDPELGHSYESNKAAFNKACNVKENLWTWFEAPGNKLRLTRFGAAMSGVKNMAPVEAILEGSFRLHGLHSTTSRFETSAGYTWGQLPEGSLIVDVGGGVGPQSLLLAKHHPQLRFAVQDREAVARDAVEVCVFCNSPRLSKIMIYS